MRHLLLVFIACALSGTAQISEHIHVDQFGYLPSMPKVAVISDPQVGYNAGSSYTPGATISLVRASDGQVVYSAAPTLWQGGAIDESAGDRGWWFDFSDHDTPGTYRIVDETTGETSADFEISVAAYDEVMEAAMRMFFYNRCNAAKPAQYAGQWSDEQNFMNPGQDADCRDINGPTDPSTAKDLSGGWFDAGDYNKYVTFAETAVHDLLSAYTENPQAFSDGMGIPESGNGLADILDEVKWELDWLMKMCNDDGSTHIKMGSTDFSTNVASPPSANTDPRYYGPTCTSASLAVAGILAHAAQVYAQDPGMATYAAQLRSEAENAWAYVQPFLANGQLQTDCDDLSIVAGDADRDEEKQLEMALIAAARLYLLTDEPAYEQYLLANITDASPISSGYWGGEEIALKDALLEYATSDSPDPAVAATIIDGLTVAVQNNWNGFYGFNETDLYRAMVPPWTYNWGSNQGKARYGTLNRLLVTHGIEAGASEDFALKASEQLHYFHGLNPQGLVYLSNMYAFGAERSINEVYHAWFEDGTDYDHALTSPIGPAPGYLVGGPNPSFTVATISPPSGQPAQKSYKDWNTSWPENSWEISEPAIYYQAAYVRLLANFVDVTAEGCAADLTADGEVDIDDFILFNSSFGNACSGCAADMDGNGLVDVGDFLILNSAFGTPCD